MKHTIKIKIYYEDTDCGGVIYYANYLRYLERARTEYMESCGLSLKKIKDKGIQFVVRHVDIEYLLPGYYSDTIIVETTVEKAEKLRIVFVNNIINESTMKIMAISKTTLICINNNFKPVRIPLEISEKIVNQHI